MNDLTFTVTENHLILLKNLYINWHHNELEIDSKRPFGDSNIYQSIIDALSLEYFKNDDEREEICEELYIGTATALQIALSVGYFKTGDYYRPEKYDTRLWLPKE